MEWRDASEDEIHLMHHGFITSKHRGLVYAPVLSHTVVTFSWGTFTLEHRVIPEYEEYSRTVLPRIDAVLDEIDEESLKAMAASNA